ncbi:MAG: hypothetical protein WCB53_18140 [Terriglobales bacterium]
MTRSTSPCPIGNSPFPTVTLYCDQHHLPVADLPSFAPHFNLSDEVNRHIIQSEIEGGVFLKDLAPDTVLQIQTQHHLYTAVLVDDVSALISGHPEYCPQPVLVAISGSTWGGSMLKRHFVGRGMRLEFSHPEYKTPIVTSSIQDIRELSTAARLRNYAAV